MVIRYYLERVGEGSEVNDCQPVRCGLHHCGDVTALGTWMIDGPKHHVFVVDRVLSSVDSEYRAQRPPVNYAVGPPLILVPSSDNPRKHNMSSKLTSAQIITLGEYLEPDFNPASLTVSQLLGILGYHNVTYPTPYSKPKLVQRFEEEIQAKATRLKKDRLKKANSIASDDGITDGLTGKPLGKVCFSRMSIIPCKNLRSYLSLLLHVGLHGGSRRSRLPPRMKKRLLSDPNLSVGFRLIYLIDVLKLH